MAPCWLGELGQSVIDAVVASMDATRRRQLSRPGAKDIKDYHCKPASEEGALELIDSLAGGSSRLRNFDRQPYFLSLAQRHGIDDIPMVRILRSHGLPDDGSEGVPDGTSVPKPPLSEPQTQTRAGEAAADASRVPASATDHGDKLDIRQQIKSISSRLDDTDRLINQHCDDQHKVLQD